MENSALLTIWSSTELTDEEKILLSKQIAEELKERNNTPEIRREESQNKYNSMTDEERRQEIIEKSRQQAAKARASKEKIEREQKVYQKELKLDKIFKEKVKRLKELNNPIITEELNLKEKHIKENSDDMSLIMEYEDYVNEKYKKYFREDALIKEQYEETIRNGEESSVDEVIKADNDTQDSDRNVEDVQEEKPSNLQDSDSIEEISDVGEQLQNEDVSDQEIEENIPKSNIESDLDALAEKMTDEEMNYVLEMKNISSDLNVSLKEAERLYKDYLTTVKNNTKESEIDAPNLSNDEPVGNEKPAPDVSTESSELKQEPNLNTPKSAPLKNNYNTKEYVDNKVEQGEVIQDYSNGTRLVQTGDEGREFVLVDTKPESKFRKQVTRIVNRVKDIFNKTTARGRAAIENSIRANRGNTAEQDIAPVEFDPSKVQITDEEILRNANLMHGTPNSDDGENNSDLVKGVERG